MKIFKKTPLRLLLITVLLLAGCDGLLDISPKQSIDEGAALETSDNVEAVLMGAYDALADDDLLGGEALYEPDLLADNNVINEVQWTGTFEEPEQIWRKNIQVENAQVSATWIAAYNTINIANNVLSALDVVDEEIRDKIEGEAKFIRGLVYFKLVELYAQPWSAGEQTTNPGVPLVLEPTRAISDEDKIPRSSVADVYTQIIADLTEAETLLPLENGEFASTYTASALLSRVYLQQAEYDKALTAANRVIGSHLYSLTDTYAEVFNSTTNTTEDIFSIQVSEQDGTNSMNTFYAPSEYAGRGDISILTAHLSQYEAGDDRLNFFFTDEGNITRTGKWINQFGNVGIIRLAEMYLTRAECNFRLSKTVGDTPLNDINTIRRRVNLSPAVVVDLTSILKERKLELMFEGELLHDLKRTQSSVGSIPYNGLNIVYPIPQRELDVNPSLSQNGGYF